MKFWGEEGIFECPKELEGGKLVLVQDPEIGLPGLRDAGDLGRESGEEDFDKELTGLVEI